MTEKVDKLTQLRKREAEKALRIVASRSFQDRITAFKEAKKAGATNSELDTILADITKTFFPNERWLSGLRQYASTGDKAVLIPDLIGPRIKLRFDSEGKKVGVDLELDPQTEREDIDAVWDLVKNVLRTIKDTPLKNQPYPRLERDSKIFAMRHDKGMSNKEIAAYLAKQGHAITPEYVSTIIKRYQERIDTIAP